MNKRQRKKFEKKEIASHIDHTATGAYRELQTAHIKWMIRMSGSVKKHRKLAEKFQREWENDPNSLLNQFRGGRAMCVRYIPWPSLEE